MGTINNELKPQQTVDRISDLPDCVQIHILSLLDTVEAIRTSVLSRRWHRMWTHVPDLKLYLNRMDNPKMLSVDRTLSFHVAPRISKFHLTLISNNYVDSTMVDLLVRRAAKRHVEDLRLDLTSLSCFYPLPGYLYSHRYLKELKTDCCHFFHKGRVNWESLRVLDVGLGLMDGKIEDLLSGCPLLESLSLRHVRLTSGLHIVHEKLKRLVLNNNDFDSEGDKGLELYLRAPQLEVLEIFGDWLWTSCKLIDILSLVHVHLNFYFRGRDDLCEKFQNAVKELVGIVRHSQRSDVKIRCPVGRAKMELESFCNTLSLPKCLVEELRVVQK